MSLTKNQESRIANINYVASSVGLLGGIAGAIYSYKTGGGFWRGVGYWIIGAVALGTVAALAALPFKNNILAEGDEDGNTDSAKTSDSNVESIFATKRN